MFLEEVDQKGMAVQINFIFFVWEKKLPLNDEMYIFTLIKTPN